MLGRQERWQEDLFVAGPLSDLIPSDHILKKVDRILDLSWLRDEVRHLYCEDNGRPGIDPEAAVRLMLAGLFQDITKDRRLMREAQVNLAIRWFAGYRLHERLPNHSALTKIRQRWGEELFRTIFDRTVTQCIEAGLVTGETVHIDATLIRADVSWESIVDRHVERVINENEEAADGPDDTEPPSPPAPLPPERSRTKRPKKYSTTDPDATLTTSRKSMRLEPSFKQHTAVDDAAGIIVDVAVTTGEASEGKQLLEQIGRIEARTGVLLATVTADAGYGHSANFGDMERRQTESIIPPQRQRSNSKSIPLRQFKYDAKHDVVRCPAGRFLERRTRSAKGWIYAAKQSVCQACELRSRCFSSTAKRRTVLIVHEYPSLLRARRRYAQRDEGWRRHYRRHQFMVEGVHGEAKAQHGLHRAARRGRWNVAVQSYLTAAVINLKRLATASCARFEAVVCRPVGQTLVCIGTDRICSFFPANHASCRAMAA